jgi:hypothetical protein
MSIETEVWTKRPGSLRDLQLGEGWVDEGGTLVKEGSGWLVNVFEPREVDASATPQDLRKASPDLRYCVELSLEPAGAPVEGVAVLASVVEAIGAAWGGAALDPTTGHVRTWS